MENYGTNLSPGLSLNRPSGPIRSSSRDVRVCVCLSVWCPFLCGIFWGLFCPHFQKSDVQNFRDLESLGKSAYLRLFEFFRFGLFFPFLIYFLVLCILGPPYCGIGATIRIGREIQCLPYAGFLMLVWHFSKDPDIYGYVRK